MAKRNIHVIPHGSGWAVKREGGARVDVVVETQKGAIERARDEAKREKGELVVHSRDGSIWSHDSYGFKRTVKAPPVRPKHLTVSQIRAAVKKRGA